MKYRYILFDLDGTLTDPFEGITKSFQFALKHFGIEANSKDLTPVIGPPLIDSFCSLYGFSEEKGKKAVAKYRERFSVIGWQENRLLDGAAELLEAVKNSGAVVALATSKPQVYAEKIINKFGIAKYFDVVVGATLDGSINTKTEVIEAVLEKLGNPPKETVVMIGDRHHDINGAKACGIDSIGVKVGYADEGELEAAGADYIFNTLQELRQFLIEN